MSIIAVPSPPFPDNAVQALSFRFDLKHACHREHPMAWNTFARVVCRLSPQPAHELYSLPLRRPLSTRGFASRRREESNQRRNTNGQAKSPGAAVFSHVALRGRASRYFSDAAEPLPGPAAARAEPCQLRQNLGISFYKNAALSGAEGAPLPFENTTGSGRTARTAARGTGLADVC